MGMGAEEENSPGNSSLPVNPGDLVFLSLPATANHLV